jgi:hypothetical protein
MADPIADEPRRTAMRSVAMLLSSSNDRSPS